MPDEKRIIEVCTKALKAARPYVVDGRNNDEAMVVLAQIDTALSLAANDIGETPPRGVS